MYTMNCLLPALVLLQSILSSGVTYSKTYNMKDDQGQITINGSTWGNSSSCILKSHSGLRYDDFKSTTLLIVSNVSTDKIVVSIRKFDVRPRCVDTISLFDASDRPLVRPVHFCNLGYERNNSFDPRERTVFFSASNKMGIRFDRVEGSTFSYGGFELIFTSLSSTPCSNKEYQCANDRCIAKKLKCDMHNHCGDYSNNWGCGNPSVKLTGNQIGIICGVIFLVIVLSCGAYVVVRRSQAIRREGTVIPPPPTVYQPQQPMYPLPHPEGQTNPTYK